MSGTLKLYKVILQGLTAGIGTRPHGVAFVVALNPDAAYKQVYDYLKSKDIGFEHERQLHSVTLEAECDDYSRLPKLFIPGRQHDGN